MIHSEIYCETLDKLDKVKAIRAIHQALLQLNAMGNQVEIDGLVYDNAPAIEALREVMRDSGHIGYID